MHLPVHFSISGSVSHNHLIDALNSCFASLVILNSNVNIAAEGVEVLLVLGGDFIVFPLVLLEPSDYFLFIEVKGEWVVLERCPFFCSSYLIGFGNVVEFLESESFKAKHGDDVVMHWVEFVLQEGLDLWDDVVDVGTVEVGVVHHIHDHFVLPALVDLLSGFDQWSEHDPVVFVESLDLKGIVVEGSFPVAHEQVVVSLDVNRPVMDSLSVQNQHEIVVDAVSANRWSSANIDVLSSRCSRNNFIFSDYFLTVLSVLMLLSKGNACEKGESLIESHIWTSFK